METRQQAFWALRLFNTLEYVCGGKASWGAGTFCASGGTGCCPTVWGSPKWGLSSITLLGKMPESRRTQGQTLSNLQKWSTMSSEPLVPVSCSPKGHMSERGGGRICYLFLTKKKPPQRTMSKILENITKNREEVSL